MPKVMKEKTGAKKPPKVTTTKRPSWFGGQAGKAASALKKREQMIKNI